VRRRPRVPSREKVGDTSRWDARRLLDTLPTAAKASRARAKAVQRRGDQTRDVRTLPCLGGRHSQHTCARWTRAAPRRRGFEGRGLSMGFLDKILGGGSDDDKAAKDGREV